MSSSRLASAQQDAPKPVSPPPGRRRIPLASTCARPHRCPRPVRMQVLGRVPFFAGLSQQKLEGIDKRMVSLSWAAGDPLFTAGESADHLYLLAAGQAKLSQPTPGGQRSSSTCSPPGTSLGR